jgi:two-component system chemotaxis sensor kinase CheA
VVNPLHEQFLIEARELIEHATEDLIALEREGDAPERIDRVFRAFHTLKGSAGVVELPALALILHAAEDLLTAIRNGSLAASPAIIDRALACLDQVSRWVDAFETDAALPPSAGGEAQAFAAEIRSFLPEHAASGALPPRPALDQTAPPDWALRLFESCRARIMGGIGQDVTGLCAVSYEPAIDCFFNGDDPLRLMQQIPDLLAFRLEPREPWASLADLDPYRCNLRLQAICGASQAEVASIFRLSADQVRIAALPLPEPRQGTTASEEPAARELVRMVIEEQWRILAAAESAEDQVGRIGAAVRAAANALRHGRHEDLAQRVEHTGAAALSGNDAASLRAVLDEALAALAADTAVKDAVPHGAPAAAGREVGLEGVASRLVRVDERRIDALVGLAGELVVAKNALSHLAKRLEEEHENPELGRAAGREHEAIGKLASEIHAAVLRLRMVPIGPLFRSFPRLVRDTTRELGKKARLIIQGESIEADKTIIDSLFEPLLHLVRNALDHGIETPEERFAGGKDETATLTLRAAQMGDRLVVEVADDGRGVDPSVIRSHAQQRRLLPDQELAALSDEHVIDLIFRAGFSTSAKVSDISGRGVGMDAVRTAVEGLAGRVSLRSRPGSGTTVRVDLPVNIAMSRIMVVRAGGQYFGIPMEAVIETLRLGADRVAHVKNNEGFVLRDRVIPICQLTELMNLSGLPSPDGAAKLLVVTEAGGKAAALEVEAIHDRLDVVIKPLRGVLAGARGYSGTTFLGDGRVLLILDLKELLP